MKRKTVLFYLLGALLFAGCVSTDMPEAEVPAWFPEYQAVFPKNDYIALHGTGDSPEYARAAAASAVAGYFQTTIDASLAGTRAMQETAGGVKKESSLAETISVTSQAEVFGLSYTEPFYVKAENWWYCVAFINREEAWTQYRPQIDRASGVFRGLYRQYASEEDPIGRIRLYGRTLESGNTLLEALEYGRILAPEKEALYQQDRDNVALVPVLYEAAASRLTVYLAVKNDYNRMVENAVSAVLGDYGIRTVKAESGAAYVAEINIEDNVAGSDPLAVTPAVTVNLQNGEGRTMLSAEAVSSEKGVGYTLDAARKKVFPKLTERLKEDLDKQLNELFNK